MKLNDVKPYYESSGDMEEHFFSIQDQGMIFDILRSKMYSNPILAICREITSNARDAHREIGRPDLPIQIHLPVGLEPEYKVKDFGPGISPDRMLNVFIKYTASTKRNDNTQTGGFGLGAKTPFSYSDTFTVTTVVGGHKYSYACSIDDTKVGKLILLNKVVSDEPNSTEIAIHVKPIDFNFFRQWTEQACRHWTTKPIITGAAIVWPDLTKIIEGNEWAVVNDNSNNSYYNKTAKLVIDGIEYPLELDTLRKYADTKLIDSARGSFIMYFGVGELTLSANREQIFWDKPTQDKIHARLGVITKEIKQRVEDKINAFPNLWDANVYYRKELNASFNNLAFLGKLSWKTHELNNGYVQLQCSNYRFTRGKWSRKTGDDPTKLSRLLSTSLEFAENTQLWLNDLPIKDPTPKHVKKAFDDDPALKQIQVICPNDKQTEKDLNKYVFLDQMNPKRLSSITKASARAYMLAASRLLVFKFDAMAGGFRQVSYDSMEEDTNDKVLAVLSRDKYPPNNRWALCSTNKRVPEHALKTLLDKNAKISIYGLGQETDPVRIQKEFSDFKSLDKFLDEKVFDNKVINYVEIKVARTHAYHVDERLLAHFDFFEKEILDKKSVFLSKLHIHRKISTMSLEDQPLLEIYESVKGLISDADVKDFMKKNPDWNLEKANLEFDKTYPLLKVIGSYNFHTVTDHIAKYVNMIDKS